MNLFLNLLEHILTTIHFALILYLKILLNFSISSDRFWSSIQEFLNRRYCQSKMIFFLLIGNQMFPCAVDFLWQGHFALHWQGEYISLSYMWSWKKSFLFLTNEYDSSVAQILVVINNKKVRVRHYGVKTEGSERQSCQPLESSYFY